MPPISHPPRLKCAACFFCLTLLSTASFPVAAQKGDLSAEARRAMMDATRYMVEKVSTQGGFVANYLPDLSRRWGELEFYGTQIQVQDAGVVPLGNIFLDASCTTAQ